MKGNIYLKLLSVILLGLSSTCLFSQITIGSDKAPVKGAILDVKTIVPVAGNTNPDNNETSQTGGIVLPRVVLQGINTLAPFVSDPTDSDVKKLHIGLIVYNVKESGNLKKGIYCWDGDKWSLLITGEVTSSPWFKVGTTLSSTQNTDNSYLTAKAVVGGNTIAPINGGDAQLTVLSGDASINGITIGLGKNKINSNIAIGQEALNTNTTGNTNVAVGFKTLALNTTGSKNIAVGTASLSNATTANDNIAIGVNAGNGITTETNNILLGANIQPSPISGTTINIANTLFGVPGATIAQTKAGIGTDDPKATLHVYGDMKYTDAPSISGGKVMMIDDAGNVGKTAIAPRLITSVDVASNNMQNITNINSGGLIPITWTSSDFTNKDIADLSLGSDNEILFNKEGSNMYELSGYVSYNPAIPPTAGYPTNISSARSEWLVVLDVLIQVQKGSSGPWETVTGSEATWSAAAMQLPKLIRIPAIGLRLSKNDKIRMVIQKTGVKDHGTGAKIESLVPIAGLGMSKGLKIINL